MSLDTRNPRRLPAYRRRELGIGRSELEVLYALNRWCFIQSTLAIPNEAGASFRADNNTALQANATFQAGASAPGTTYADQFWYDTTNQVLKKRNQANSAWIVISTRDEAFVVSRSSNTILGLSDIGKTFVVTSSFTQTLTAAATLGDGWYCFYRNDGTGVITLDPNSTETIDGSLTAVLNPGEACRIACNGSTFKTQGLTQRVIVKRKTADETVTSSTTLQDDDHLTFPIAANEEWIAEFILINIGDSLSTTGLKTAITVPAGATMDATSNFQGGTGDAQGVRGTTSGAALTAYTPAGSNLGNVRVYVWVLNGATAGNVTLQWAQNASSATALTARKGGHVKAVRLA